MPRKKAAEPTIYLGIRCPKTLAVRLNRAAVALGLDVSGIVRMILLEHVTTYEVRADRACGRICQAISTK